MKTIAITAALAGALALGGVGAAQAWQPTKPIEFVVTSGAGGGTDNFARIIQSIITKHKLIEQPIVVVNKGGGSRRRGLCLRQGRQGRSEPRHLRHQQRLSAALRRQARLQAHRT